MRLCCLNREPRSQTRGEIERVIFWLRQIMQSFGVGERRAEMRMDAERQPYIGCDQGAHPAKTIRRDTDHAVRLSINLEIAPNEVTAAAHPFPKCMTGDHDRQVSVRSAFVCSIKPATQRLHAHEGEEIFRSQKGEASPHLMIAADSGNGELKRC